MRQHILPRVVCSSALKPTPTSSRSQRFNVVNVDGRRLNVTASRRAADGRSEIYVDGAEVIETDLMATNGVVHIIDSVLLIESGQITFCHSQYID